MRKGLKLDIKYWLIIIFAVSTGIRLFINFSHELIPGVNGGYYPLQVRSILENGHLEFSDMPLLFYLNAAIIKFMSLIGFPISDTLILNVVKIVDSISLPLLLFPLYRILRLINPSEILQISILAFSVLSFSPLVLTSDLQKNALAIVFVFVCIAYYIAYQVDIKKINLYLSISFLILSGLTHFGTFVFGLCFLLTMVFYTYRKKAIIPVTILLIISLGIVFIMDSSRFNRLVSFWTVIFEKPAMINGMLQPPDFLIILLSILIAIVGIVILKSKGSRLDPFQKAIIFACIICLFACSFPLLDAEYFKRLSLFLFIPQILLIIPMASIISIKRQKATSVFLFVFTFLSIIAVTGHLKEAVIDKNAYSDLKKMQSVVENDNETIVIARHGLEWWSAWVLKTKVGQDKAIDKSLFEQYENIIILNQINGFSSEMARSPFHEPFVPNDSELIYSSDFFKAFKIK